MYDDVFKQFWALSVFPERITYRTGDFVEGWTDWKKKNRLNSVFLNIIFTIWFIYEIYKLLNVDTVSEQ